jgi:CRP-like cAMP-binding protein
VLRQIEIFSDLRDDQLEWFASSADEIVLDPGDVLLHEGDAADALFVVLEGEVRGRRENRRIPLTVVAFFKNCSASHKSDSRDQSSQYA